MVHDIFVVLLWITAILLIISGLDDFYLDMLYWLLKGRHREQFPDFSEMHNKEEKPIAIFLGAWNESGVIGRTLSFAVNNIAYKNYKIFVGVYPNDLKTIKVVKDISRLDPRIIACINQQDGPTTKADNLNCLYAGLCDYEKIYGEFEIIIVHDAEDFIHMGSMKLYNFLLGYKGYHGVQIPVLPIKSKHGKIYHRTYCDAFAEIHTKDMIVRQGMDTFMPFSGTGMGFHRKVMYYLEKSNFEILNKNSGSSVDEFKDPWGRKIELGNKYFKNEDDEEKALQYNNNTKYLDNPFMSLDVSKAKFFKSTKAIIINFTLVFLILLLTGIGFLIYKGNSSGNETILQYFQQSTNAVKAVPDTIPGYIINSDSVFTKSTGKNNKNNKPVYVSKKKKLSRRKYYR
jgi:hypothetical protein